MKKFASYLVEFNGCNHMLNFDFCIGWDVESNNEIIVHAWYHDGADLLEGEFSITCNAGTFKSDADYSDVVHFLLNQYCI